MRRILILGKVGQLGWELERTLATVGEITILDYPEIDFLQPLKVMETISAVKPDIVFNAVAYTAVDKAESDIENARLINTITPGELANHARKLGVPFVHYSTDFVFDGKKETAYIETDVPNPINVYGSTKLEGEKAIQQVGGVYLIFRTSWLYSTRKDSFLVNVLKWARKNKTLRIVSDQVGSPTWARSLAEISAQAYVAGGKDPREWLAHRSGVYHLGGSGHASRYEWAKTILECDPKKDEQIVERLEAVSTDEFPSPAARPAFSGLDCTKFEQNFGLALPRWQECIRMALQD